MKQRYQYFGVLARSLVFGGALSFFFPIRESQDICHVRTHIDFTMTIFGQCYNVFNNKVRYLQEIG